MKTLILSALKVDFQCVLVDMYEVQSEKDYNFHWTKEDLDKSKIYKEHPHQTDFKDGQEQHPHITALFGLANREDYFKAWDICKKTKPFSLEIGNFKAFRNEDQPYDVLVLEIKSQGLVGLNKELSKIEGVEVGYDYTPHLTVAYINKGEFKELEGKPAKWTGTDYNVKKLVFSTTDENKLPLELKGISK